MECATHPGRASVGYCKKCGAFGCGECLVKVSLTGQVGKKLSATEVLLCKECLSKARPDLFPSTSNRHSSEQSSKPKRSTHIRGAGIRVSKKTTIAILVAVVIAAGAAGAFVFLSRAPTASQPSMPADEFASRALKALVTGDDETFMSCVDVCAFMCKMDSSGLTSRDYTEADDQKRTELEAMHTQFLKDVLCVPANRQREFNLVSFEVKENSASIRVKPWIAYGRKSYKRILLANRGGRWRICGLATPDF